ncbi:MAG: hypothetical protein H6737_24560 [Alphaproteobacteria bacterium]|nr:hypothetical protein [Alphaproteobacteria bacterium]
MKERILALPAVLQGLWVLAVGMALSIGLSTQIILPRIVVCFQHPVHDPWLPAVLQTPVTFAGALGSVLLSALVAAIRPTVTTLRVFAWALLLGGATSLVHQAGMGWAGGILWFWLGVWAVWAAHVHRCPERAPFFGLLVIGGIFAYPALGKLTPGFWTGELYWQMHWSYGGGVHTWLEENLPAGMHHDLVRVYGPFSILTEAVLSLVWLLPMRVGYGLSVVVFLGILLTAGPRFTDAMTPLIAFAFAGWWTAEARMRSAS